MRSQDGEQRASRELKSGELRLCALGGFVAGRVRRGLKKGLRFLRTVK